MYNYETQKQTLFTDEGQKMFLKIRDKVRFLLKEAGAFKMLNVMSVGDTSDMLACVDRLVELGEIREVTKGMAVAGQHRVFVAVPDPKNSAF